MAERTRQTPNTMASGRQHWETRRLIPAWVSSRFKGPGALYNIGNIIALLAGIGLALRDVHSHTQALSGLHHQLMGSAPAAWLTVSMLVFVVSGELYHRAFHGPAERQAGLNQSADLISGLAAIALTIALLGFGDTTSAIFAGVLLAGGKLGSALLPALHVRRPLMWQRLMRLVVLGSRFPSIASLALTVMIVARGEGAREDALLPLIMIGCFALWLWADLILLRQIGGRASAKAN